MEFKKIGAFSRTPKGYRLSTLAEVNQTRHELRRWRILDSSSEARVLDGIIRDTATSDTPTAITTDTTSAGTPTDTAIPPMSVEKPPFIVAGRKLLVSADGSKIPADSLPKHMIVYGKTSTHVSVIPGLLREKLYKQVSLDDEGRIVAFRLSFVCQDIEVIDWLRRSATSLTQLDDLKAEFKLYNDDTDGFSKIVKWLLFENDEIQERDVSDAFTHALRDTASTDPEAIDMEADHAIATVEIIVRTCSGQGKMDLISSQIDEMTKSSEMKIKHAAVLAKLLSECSVRNELKECWNGIIKTHFEKLLKEAVRRGYVPLVKYFLKLKHNGGNELEYSVRLPKSVEDKEVVKADGNKMLLHYAAAWEGGKSESSDLLEDKDDWEGGKSESSDLLEDKDDWEGGKSESSDRLEDKDDVVDAVSKSLFKAYTKDFVKQEDNLRRNVLHFASFGGRDKFCEFLVDNYDLQDVVDDSRQNFLHYAAQGKNGYRIVDRLHEKLKGSDLVSSINNRGETPLHQAAVNGQAEMVNSLMLRFKPILTKTLKQTDYGGRTPLHLAAYYGHLKAVEELLKAGSDPLEDRDIGGKTALHNIVENRCLPIEDAKALIDVLMDHFDDKKQKALFLWASAIGIGTAHKMRDLRKGLETFLQEKEESLKDVNLIEAAVSKNNSRMTWELLNRGGDFAGLDTWKLMQVKDQLVKFSVQATDRFTTKDILGRQVLADCIAAHFLNPYIKAPITVGIAGASGMGKTSLLNMIEAGLLVTAAQLAFPDSWKNEEFNGAKKVSPSKRMSDRIEKGVAKLLFRGEDRTYKEIIRYFRQDDKVALLYFLSEYLPKYKDVYKYLARMDFNQLLENNEEESVYEEQGQSLGAIPRILTVNFNAGNYRGRQEAWAGLALEITKEIEASMTLAQYLSTCWRYAWRKNSPRFYVQFILPCLTLIFLVVWIACAAWMFLERSKDSQLKKLTYGSIPVTVIAIIWSAFKGALSIFRPVSKQLSSYFSLPDYSQQLGYQEKVIADINFLKEEIGKEPKLFFSLIAGEKCKYWGGLMANRVEGTPVPKYSSAPHSKLRIIAFVDDLDHCEDEVILRVFWAINLVFRVCEISVILTMDKNTIRTAFQNSSQKQDEDYVDKFISKVIQLPVSLPDPADTEWAEFLKHELTLSEPDSISYEGRDEDIKEDENEAGTNRETVASAENENVARTNRETVASAEDDVNTVNRQNDGEIGNIKRRGGCISSSYSMLMQMQKSLASCFTKILSCLHKEENKENQSENEVNKRNDIESATANTTCEGCIPSSYSLLIQMKKCIATYIEKIHAPLQKKESEEKQPEGSLSDSRREDLRKSIWGYMSDPIWQLRQIVMQGFTEEEIETLHNFKGFATGIHKLPREWRNYINYHKFTRNVIVKKVQDTGKYPCRTVEFVAWTFVCWQWKREMNILIKDWHSYSDVKDKDGEIKREPSLKEIVANYIKRRWPVQAAQAGEADCDEEEKKKKEWGRLKEALDTVQDMAMKGLSASKEVQCPREIGKLLGLVPSIGTSMLMDEEETKREKERWYNLLKALHVVQDVSMAGIQWFQHFRFHCDDKNLTLPLEHLEHPVPNRGPNLSPALEALLK